MFKLNVGKRLDYIMKLRLEEGFNSLEIAAIALMVLGISSLLILMDAVSRYILYIDMNERLMNVLGVCILGILAIILIFGKDEYYD